MPAAAQVAIEGALQTDHRVRGYSVSDEEPAASLSVSYDDPSGVYAGSSAVGTIRHGEPTLLGIQADLGYAMRLGPKLSIDAGVSHSQYFAGYGGGPNYNYTETYVGLALPHVAARLSYSPDYFRNGTNTLYAELDGGFEPVPDWFLSAHAGALTYLDRPPGVPRRARYDWRVGASRQFDRFAIHVDIVGRIGGEPDGIALAPVLPRIASGRTTVVVSLTHAF
jgi:uncharacterized protein (TIGR02001 family)